MKTVAFKAKPSTVTLWLQSDDHSDLVSMLFPSRFKMHVLIGTRGSPAAVLITPFPSVLEMEQLGIRESLVFMGNCFIIT